MKEWANNHPVCFTILVLATLLVILEVILPVLLFIGGLSVASDLIELTR